MIIDAHHHLWTADYPWLTEPAFAPIRRDYTVEDLRGHLRAAGVDRTVLVEASIMRDSETTAFLAMADTTPEIAGVVGWASLTDPALTDTIAAHRAGRGGHLLVGVRDQVQGQPDDFLDRPDARRGLRAIADAGLVNEFVVRVSQLPSVARAVADLPESRVVLDHLGKPRIGAGRAGLDEWRAAIGPLAAQPNVVAKLSGLVTEVDWRNWTIDDLRPFVETAIELFGTDRLMFGSDWPVCELASSYVEVKDTLAGILGGLPDDIFRATAVSTYQLEIR
jgi:L-fuconolactonase